MTSDLIYVFEGFKALRPNFTSSYSAARVTAAFHPQIACKEGKPTTKPFPLARWVFPYALSAAAWALLAAPGPGPEHF